MELGSFVRVVVRLTGGQGAVGTGYFLAGGRILTAGHVVRDAAAVEVELDGTGGELQRLEADVAWCNQASDGGLDAAVLRCELTSATPPEFSHLARGPLARATPWQSRGCARAAVEGPTVGDSMASLRGTAYPSAAHEERLELAVEAGPKQADDWSGISGAPVLAHGRIYGVIREAPVRFEGNRLYATPMHRLLGREGFVAVLGVSADEKWQSLLDEVRALLSEDHEAAKAIAERQQSWRRGFADDGGAGLAAAICERSSIDEALLAMHVAHRELVGHGRRASARTVEEVLARIVPLLYDQQLVYALPPEGGVVLRVPVATSTIAEMAMAGVDARTYRYLPLEKPSHFPEPVANVAGYPEPGIDVDGARGYKDFVDHLANTFVAEEDRHTLRQEGRAENERYQELARLVDDELAWRAEHGAEGPRRYYLFDSEFRSQHAPFLEQLKSSLPALRLVELTGGDLPGERRLCRPLRELLHRAQSRGRSTD